MAEPQDEATIKMPIGWRSVPQDAKNKKMEKKKKEGGRRGSRRNSHNQEQGGRRTSGAGRRTVETTQIKDGGQSKAMTNNHENFAATKTTITT